jgi:hypothetical protein
MLKYTYSLFGGVKRRQQNQKFPSFQIFRFAAGGVGGIPPADLPVEVSTQAGPSQFRSDIFKQTPLSFTFSKIERDFVQKPSVQTMAKIAKALGVSIEALLK